MADAHRNFAVSTVATAPSPATSGTSLVVASGEGTRFPTVPFNATIWPAAADATAANAEIVRVTNVATDTLTITRSQESTSARTVLVGDRIAATITAKTVTDAEAVHVYAAISGRPTTAGLVAGQEALSTNGQRWVWSGTAWLFAGGSTISDAAITNHDTWDQGGPASTWSPQTIGNFAFLPATEYWTKTGLASQTGNGTMVNFAGSSANASATRTVAAGRVGTARTYSQWTFPVMPVGANIVFGLGNQFGNPYPLWTLTPGGTLTCSLFSGSVATGLTASSHFLYLASFLGGGMYAIESGGVIVANGAYSSSQFAPDFGAGYGMKALIQASGTATAGQVSVTAMLGLT